MADSAYKPEQTAQAGFPQSPSCQQDNEDRTHSPSTILETRSTPSYSPTLPPTALASPIDDGNTSSCTHENLENRPDDVTSEDTIPYPHTPRLPQASLYIDPEEATDDSNALANAASLRHPQRISCNEGNISLLLHRLDRLCILYGVDLAEFYLAWRHARNNQELQLWLLDSVTAAIEGTMEINIEIESAPPTLETLTDRVDIIESDLPKSPQDYREKFPVIAGVYGPQVSIRTLYLVVIGTVKLLPSILPYVFWIIMGDNDDRSILRFASVNGKMIGKKLGYMFIESENINGVLDGWLGLRDHMAWMKRFTKAMDMPYFRWPLNQEEKDLIKLGSDLLRLVPQE